MIRVANKSGFTDKEVAEYLKKRQRPTFHEAVEKIQCIHCGQSFNAAIASAGDHGLCDYCLHKD